MDEVERPRQEASTLYFPALPLQLPVPEPAHLPSLQSRLHWKSKKVPALLLSSCHPPQSHSLANHRGTSHPVPLCAAQAMGRTLRSLLVPLLPALLSCPHVLPSWHQPACKPKAAPAPLEGCDQAFRERAEVG